VNNLCLYQQLTLARELVKQGRPQEAIAVLDQLGGAESADLGVLGALGDALKVAGRCKEAQAVQLRIAEIKASEEFVIQAIVHCRVALRLHGEDHGPIHLQLAGYYKRIGLHDDQRRHTILAICALAGEGRTLESQRALAGLPCACGRPA
jgi:hypothetical protein